MNIAPSSGVHHSSGNPLAQSAPTAQLKTPTSTQTAAAPAPGSSQREDAVRRPEAPTEAKISPSSEPRQSTETRSSEGSDQRGYSVDLVV